MTTRPTVRVDAARLNALSEALASVIAQGTYLRDGTHSAPCDTVTRLENALKSLSDDVCPTCRRAITTREEARPA